MVDYIDDLRFLQLFKSALNDSIICSRSNSLQHNKKKDQLHQSLSFQ